MAREASLVKILIKKNQKKNQKIIIKNQKKNQKKIILNYYEIFVLLKQTIKNHNLDQVCGIKRVKKP